LDLEPAGRTVIDLTDQPVPAVAAPG
jgi:hypothetical protein